MITTKQVNVNLEKGRIKLNQVTTKTVDASIKVEPPKAPIKAKSITTTTLPDVADIAEKKRRDDIMAEQKLAMKDKKKIVMVEKETSFQENIVTYQKEQNEIIAKEKSLKMKAEKKPWNKMNTKERKEYQAEKARKKK